MNFVVGRYHRWKYAYVSCLSNQLTTMRIRNLFEVFATLEGQTTIVFQVFDSLQTGQCLKTSYDCLLVSFALELISV